MLCPLLLVSSSLPCSNRPVKREKTVCIFASIAKARNRQHRYLPAITYFVLRGLALREEHLLKSVLFQQTIARTQIPNTHERVKAPACEQQQQRSWEAT